MYDRRVVQKGSIRKRRNRNKLLGKKLKPSRNPENDRVPKEALLTVYSTFVSSFTRTIFRHESTNFLL